MNFSFVIKMIFVSFFVFVLIYAINFSSTQQDLVSSNNFGVKNATKEAVNIGQLRIHDEVTYDENILIDSIIENYIKSNNITADNVQFQVAVNENIVTVKLVTSKNLFSQVSGGSAIFSYKIERNE